jgi:hypothetical protein
MIRVIVFYRNGKSFGPALELTKLLEVGVQQKLHENYSTSLESRTDLVCCKLTSDFGVKEKFPNSLKKKNIYTHIYINIYIYIYVCVCVQI